MLRLIELFLSLFELTTRTPEVDWQSGNRHISALVSTWYLEAHNYSAAGFDSRLTGVCLRLLVLIAVTVYCIHLAVIAISFLDSSRKFAIRSFVDS